MLLCADTALDLRRVYGPEPATPTDFQREADHERLVRGFPVEKIRPSIDPPAPGPGEGRFRGTLTRSRRLG